MIQVVDYGAGNLRSVVAALVRLGAPWRLVKAASDLDLLSPLILPGVGAAGRAMESLRATGIAARLPKCTAPVLGICLGMQLMTGFSEEDHVAALGILPGRVRKMETTQKLPHMGWNTVTWSDNALPPSDLYFAHSYCVETEPRYVVATCEYGQKLTVVVRRDNFWGIQCHPEKSGEAGAQLLKNFLEKGALC